MNYRPPKTATITSVLKAIALAGFIVAAFAAGIYVGAYLLPPTLKIQPLKETGPNYSQLSNDDSAKKLKLFYFAFKADLYGGLLEYPTVKSIEEIHTYLQEMLMPAASFDNAYEKLNVLGHEKKSAGIGNIEIFSTQYELDGKPYRGYAYFKKKKSKKGSHAVLLIPGSGNNQSSRIISNNPSNYHGNIAEVAGRRADLYVYVKPNEDFLSIHNGKNKLHYNFIIKHLINNGGSYSSLYIVHSLALTKYLKQTYEKVVVLGLSQGGGAALLNSLQSKPDGAVISSGFSAMSKTFSRGAFRQIIIPNLNAHYGVDKTYQIINESATRYLFTYGKLEKGIYGIEADHQYTCNYFMALSNVSCMIHSSNHAFPIHAVDKFLVSVFR
jgi:hypothetical protein